LIHMPFRPDNVILARFSGGVGIWLDRSIENKDVTGGYNDQFGTVMLHSVIAQGPVKGNFSGA
jgi:hypothetical protein